MASSRTPLALRLLSVVIAVCVVVAFGSGLTSATWSANVVLGVVAVTSTVFARRAHIANAELHALEAALRITELCSWEEAKRRSGHGASPTRVTAIEVANFDIFSRDLDQPELLALRGELIDVIAGELTEHMHLLERGLGRFVVLDASPGASHPRDVATRIATALDDHTAAGHRHLHLRFGVSSHDTVCPDDQLDEAIHAAADDACGEQRIRIATTRPADRTALDLLPDFRRALDHAETRIVLQPKVDLATGRIVGSEALARWEHPIHGPISPAVFARLAEEHGLLAPLTDTVRASVLRVLSSVENPLTQKIAMNVTPSLLKDSRFVATLLQGLERHDVAPSRLEVEVTEQGAASSECHAMMRTLRGEGVTIAIDDFGTGFSSLSSIAHLPADVIKLDRAFLDDIEHDQVNRRIVSAVVDIAAATGKDVVAEGIETAAAAATCAELGCLVGQGYYFSRPIELDDITAMPQRLGGIGTLTST